MNQEKIDLIFKDDIIDKSPKINHFDIYNINKTMKSPIKKQCTFNLNLRTAFSQKKKGILKKEKSLKTLNRSQFYKSNEKSMKRNSLKSEHQKIFSFSQLVKKIFRIDYNINFNIIQKKNFYNLKIYNLHNNNIEYINSKRNNNENSFYYKFKNLKITKSDCEIKSNYLYCNKIKNNIKNKCFCCF